MREDGFKQGLSTMREDGFKPGGGGGLHIWKGWRWRVGGGINVPAKIEMEAARSSIREWKDELGVRGRIKSFRLNFEKSTKTEYIEVSGLFSAKETSTYIQPVLTKEAQFLKSRDFSRPSPKRCVRSIKDFLELRARNKIEKVKKHGRRKQILP